MKVKIIKEHRNARYCDYCDTSDSSAILEAMTEWDEVTHEECKELYEAIQYLNSSEKNSKYHLFEQVTNQDHQIIFSSASEIITKIRKEKEKAEKEQLARQKVNEEKKIEKKRKQLEKLQNELASLQK